MKLILFFVIMSHSQAFGNTDLSAYAAKLEKSEIPAPTIRWANPLSPADLAAVTLVSSDTTRKQSEKPFNIQNSFKLKNVKLENHHLILEVEQDQRKFRIHTSQLTHAEGATASLMRSIGLSSPRQWYADTIQVELGKFHFQDIARFLSQSQMPRAWKKLVDTPALELNDKILVLKKSLIIESDSSQNTWNWSDSGAEIRQKLLFSAFAQCGNILSGKNVNFQNCLGNTPFVATPNALPNRMVDYVRRNSTSVIEFRMAYQDPTANSAFEKLNATDIATFLARLMVLSYKDVSDIFQENGYPVDLAKLYALKLISRRNSLAEAFSASPAQAPDIRKFSVAPYIAAGNVVENWPEFEADLTKSALDALFVNLASGIGEKVDALAREMASTMPFFDVELGKVGKVHISSGIVVRMNRSVTENPEPNGVSDLFLTQDHLDVGVTLGAGLEHNLKINVWSSMGGGYMRSYSRIKSYASKQAAMRSTWLVPFEIVVQQDYSSLKPGEAFAIQQGFIGVAGFGSAFWSGQIVRPSVYVLGVAEILSTMQVYRSPQNDLVIISGTTKEALIQSKAFWRIYSKFFRLSFASFNTAWGTQSVKKYRIPLSDPNLPIEVQFAATQALRTGNAYLLDDVVKSENLDTAFFSRNWNYNLYYLNASSSVNKTEFIPQKNDSSEMGKYLIFRSGENSGNRFDGGNLHSAGCTTTGVLAYLNSESNEVSDAVVTIKCNLASERRKNKDWQSDILLTKSMFPLSVAQLSLLDRTAQHNSELGSAFVSVRLRIGAKSLLSLFDNKSESSIPEFKKFARGIKAEEKMQNLIDFLASLSISDLNNSVTKGSNFKALMKLIPDLEVTLTTQVEADQSLLGSEGSRTEGQIQRGPAFLYLLNREKVGERLLFDSL